MGAGLNSKQPIKHIFKPLVAEEQWVCCHDARDRRELKLSCSSCSSSVRPQRSGNETKLKEHNGNCQAVQELPSQ